MAIQTKQEIRSNLVKDYTKSGFDTSLPNTSKLIDSMTEILHNQMEEIERIYSLVHVNVTVDAPVSKEFKPECGYYHDWIWYDSGFTRFQYCSKCNKERST